MNEEQVTKLRGAIKNGLPRRQLQWDLIGTLVRHLCANDWKQLDGARPHVKRHKRQLQKLAVIAKKLKTALDKANASLLELGIKPEAQIIDAPNNLQRIVSQSSQALQKWQTTFTSKSGADLKPRVDLSAALYDYCKRADLTGEEVDTLFDSINATGLTPNLSRDTLKKRKNRARKSRGQNKRKSAAHSSP